MGDAPETNENNDLGFIVIDGNGVLFGLLSGKTHEVIHTFSIDLPKKDGRGRQSDVQFARLLMEKRHNYLKDTADLATQFYINLVTSKPFVGGLIIAGSDEFKTELSQSDMLDQRLKAIILKVVDVSYGGVEGFHQAIEVLIQLCINPAPIHPIVKLIQEKRLLRKYFKEISQETGKYVTGIEGTLKALETGAVETLIVWENLDITRYTLKNSRTSKLVIKHLTKKQESDQSNFRDTNAKLLVKEKTSLLQWFATEYKNFGCTLEFVTNDSLEGTVFCREFGGIGGILRYQLELSDEETCDDSQTDDDSQYLMYFPIEKLMGLARVSTKDKDQAKAPPTKAQKDEQIDSALLAEERRLYSDMELTDNEIERMVMVESREAFKQRQKEQQFSASTIGKENCSTSSAQPKPSSSSSCSGGGGPSSADTNTNTNMVISSSNSSSVQVLLSMGFSSTQAMEAYTIFGEDVDSMICYLLETDNTISGNGTSTSSSKGKGKLD